MRDEHVIMWSSIHKGIYMSRSKFHLSNFINHSMRMVLVIISPIQLSACLDTWLVYIFPKSRIPKLMPTAIFLLLLSRSWPREASSRWCSQYLDYFWQFPKTYLNLTPSLPKQCLSYHPNTFCPSYQLLPEPDSHFPRKTGSIQRSAEEIIQWNLYKTVTLGTRPTGCYTEVACL